MFTRSINSMKSFCKMLHHPRNSNIRKKIPVHSSVPNDGCDYSTGINTNLINLSNPAKEISIPFSYGSLAAKAWGYEKGYPVLALHGWLDNCGTFDKLIPLLDQSMYVVALDFPGHGFSSHKPKGCNYTYADMVFSVSYARDYFKWPRFHIIGHSMGAEIGQLYASYYPNHVEKLVALDTIKPISHPTEKIPERYIKVMESIIKLEQKLETKSPSVYSEQAALERLMQAMHGELPQDSANILLKRGTRLSSCGSGQVFTRDLRIKNIEDFYAMSDSTAQEVLSRLTCELLILKANRIHPNFDWTNAALDSVFVEMFAKNCKQFAMETVDGNHFVHLNEPKKIAHLINKFIVNKSNLDTML